MKIAVLFSGGKDSTRTVHWCMKNGYKIKYLVSFVSERHDSYMFHIPNIHMTDLAAEAIGIELIKKKVSGIKENEVEDEIIIIQTYRYRRLGVRRYSKQLSEDQNTECL